MNDKEVQMIIECHEELKDALSSKIKINHDQILSIVAADLLNKYISCLHRDSHGSNTVAFEKVLMYYFGGEDISDIKEKILAMNKD